jgi:hypothetical protein
MAPRVRQTKAAAAAPAEEPVVEERPLTAAEQAALRADAIALTTEAFDARVRELLVLGVPGNELRDRIVRVFDALDDERAAARDRGDEPPYPLVRL